MREKILIVEDDPNILLGLQEILRSESFVVETCARGDQALEAAKKFRPDLVLLDLMLPGENGYDVCRSLREENGRVPVLMLTAKSQEIDKVIGLQSGADDYVTKPFGVRELLARIEALLRRVRRDSHAPQAPFQLGEAWIDPAQFQLRRGSRVEELTPREMKLLQYFHAHKGEVLSRDRLLNAVWGCQYYGTTRTLDQTVAQLRKKLGESAPPRLLLTVHGVGYKLSGDSPASEPS
jgi:DNA-binding response OmpR family regulator